MNRNNNAKLPAIEFRNVCFSFDGLRVLNDVSFVLNRGEMILLTGASGSGKSVLLRLAMGLLRPDSGQILIEGKEIQKLDEVMVVEGEADADRLWSLELAATTNSGGAGTPLRRR